MQLMPTQFMSMTQEPSIDQINRVIRTEFGLSPVDDVVNIEIVRRKQDPERYDRLRAEFEEQLLRHPDAQTVRRRSYFGENFAIHLQSSFARKEVAGIEPELVVHYPICTLEEIRRIQTPSCAADYLLALRADAIADSPRLKRVFLARRKRQPRDWSLSSHFEATAFERYLSALSEEERAACQGIPAGMAFLREPNGVCIRSPRGDFMVVSESLQTYLYYMNVFLHAQDDIPMGDCMAALMIALRTMFLTEAQDFDLDPRGPLPQEVDSRIAALVESQLQFVIGHEYAHLLLGHLTLPPKNVPLAECFNASKENGNDENSAGALHAGVQAGSGAAGRGWAEHRGGSQIVGRGGADAVQLGQGAASGQAQRR